MSHATSVHHSVTPVLTYFAYLLLLRGGRVRCQPLPLHSPGPRQPLRLPRDSRLLKWECHSPRPLASRGSRLRYGWAPSGLVAMDSAPSGLVAARSAALRPGRSRRFHGSQRSGAAERPRRAPRPISPRVGAADRARALLTGARQRHPHRHRQPPLYTPRRPIGTPAGLLRLQPPPSAPPLWTVAPLRQQPSHYRTPAPPLALPHACTAPCTTARLHRPRTTGAHRCRAPTKARMHVGREALS